MRLALTVMCLALGLVACVSKTYDPKALIDIKTDARVQADVFAITRSFGNKNGFTVLESDSLPRQGRLVSQILLKRDDGVVMSMDNFMDAGLLTAFFYAEKPQADWRSSEKAWEESVVKTVGNRGVVTDVPVK